MSLCVPFYFCLVTEAKQVNGQQGLALLMIEAKKRPLSLWRGTAGPTLAKKSISRPSFEGRVFSLCEGHCSRTRTAPKSCVSAETPKP